MKQPFGWPHNPGIVGEGQDFSAPEPWRRPIASALVALYSALIYGVPLGMIAHGATHPPLGILELLAIPLAFTVIAGVLARLHMSKVVEGRLKVDTAIPAYFQRRLYGFCWTAVYYSGPIYFLVLLIPTFRRLVFRLFGYRGSMSFTIYPDTWIRDLPLLDLGEGCYLSNRSSLGSNMIFYRNGEKVIEVGGIRIGKRSLLGHFSGLGPSVVIGDDVQIRHHDRDWSPRRYWRSGYRG